MRAQPHNTLRAAVETADANGVFEIGDGLRS